MDRSTSRVIDLLKHLWRADRPLTATGLLMLVALVASVIGLAIDPRAITGAPAWLKPSKFAASIAIYTLTLAWVFTYLPGWRKTRRLVGWATAGLLVLELAIIDLQAARGTTSHFNVGTPLDAVLWVTMGLAIVAQTLTSLAVAVALWRQPFVDRALGWALRLGLAITILGASTGGLMTQPTAAQLAQARATDRLPVSGAHTVGAPDGGPGMPGTNWTLEHGDIRVPHFIGLHGLQALPLITLAFRRRPETTRVRLTIAAAASYGSLFGLLLWQALRGQALLQPDAATIAAFTAWAVLMIATVWLASVRGHLSAHAV
ncbi:MAG: hypothetical protein ACRD15_03230 [Vicinamibacterales bacterium]